MATLATSGAVKLFAGANAATLTSEQYETFLKKAEGFVSLVSRYDWVANYATIPDNQKEALQEATAKRAAADVINYNMSGFTSRTESQVMLDKLYSDVVDILNMLRDDKFKAYTQKGSVE